MATRTFQEGVSEGGLYKFSNVGNWVEGSVPVTGDRVIIGAALVCTYDVDYPAVASVLSSDTVNFVAGTYHEAEVGEVQSGVTFGPASAYTGTLSVETSNYFVARATQAVGSQTHGIKKG